MSERLVACGPGDFEPLIRSEIARGNRGGPWTTPPAERSFTFRHALDLDAVRAEFDLPDCLEEHVGRDGRNSLGCRLTRCAVVGGPGRGGWWAARARRQWWARHERGGRLRRTFAPRDADGSGREPGWTG